MNLAIIGTGYVGLVQGACFADTGNHVVCMDIDQKKIDGLKKGIMPIYEPGLAEIVERNRLQGRIEFTSDMKSAVEQSDLIFLCLPTPQSEDGSADLSHVLKAVEEMAKYVNGYKVIVSKSTVPIGTVDRIAQLMQAKANHPVDVASNPEFLKEGEAVAVSMKPDRVVIGSRSRRAIAMLQELYEPFVSSGKPILVMDERSAEMTKYAANAFLATKISFMNELANLCELVGADVDVVRRGIGSDPRIGQQFLYPGVGYGGSCFPKDVKALIRIAQEIDGHFRILESVDRVNQDQKHVLVRKLEKHLAETLNGRTVAVWGLSFKPQTDDMREAPSVAIISSLLASGVKVRAHDPIAIERAKEIFGSRVEFVSDPYEALTGADALLLVTEWMDYRRPDFDRMKKLMKAPVVFDGRNVYEPKDMSDRGFIYYAIGRGARTAAKAV
jgi:UDPglucose 6-dehydrogenase